MTNSVQSLEFGTVQRPEWPLNFFSGQDLKIWNCSEKFGMDGHFKVMVSVKVSVTVRARVRFVEYGPINYTCPITRYKCVFSVVSICIIKSWPCWQTRYLSFLPREATHSAVLPWQVVCPSVCLSVTLRYRDHIGWNSAKIISRLISLTISLSADPNMTDLFQREHPQILAGIWVGYGKISIFDISAAVLKTSPQYFYIASLQPLVICFQWWAAN